MRQFRFKTQKGQSLFEVVLSLGVMTFIIVALIVLASNSVRNATFSRNKTLATRYSQEAVEWLRGERDLDWDLFHSRALSGTYCLATLNWNSIGSCGSADVVGDTILTREMALTVESATQIEADVSVFWEDAQGIHEVRTTTTFVDWRSLN